MGPQNWFVVVNRKSAKIFEVAHRPDSLTWLKTLRNPLGTAKNKVMSTDKPGYGRSKYAAIKSPHALTRERDPHEDIAIEFAKKIAQFLKNHKLENNFMSLTIAAEPHMMGLVKKALTQDKVKVPIKWLRKDLEKMTTEKLEVMFFKPKKVRLQ